MAVALLRSTVEPAMAAGGGAAIVVSQDRGGLLGERSSAVRQLRATGQRVELHGVCYSACTLYLALENVCVASTADLGFHGPSWYGRPLSATEFEYWSSLVASHYREPLRSWYMNTARYRISGYYRLRGAELIRMGYPRC